MPVTCSSGDDHCCYFGEVCEFLEENKGGRRWSCSLFAKYGSWEEVYQSPEWERVYAASQAVGLRKDYRCGDWPYPGQTCGACGLNG